MASVHDVAQYVLQRTGPTTAMKLQKLLYYCQAWSLVWDDAPMFDSRIEAWANGPVIPEIYAEHRGAFLVTEWPKGDAGQLSESQRETVDSVLNYYGNEDAHWLSELTHQEAPWRDAREGLAPGQRGAREITLAAMAEYYGSL